MNGIPLKGTFVAALVLTGLILSVAHIRGRVCEELDVLYGFKSVEQLQQTLKAEAYCLTNFTQDGKSFIGITLKPSRYSPVLMHTQFFHQAAPVYIFDSAGQRVGFSRNHNDDHLFIHRWPDLFPAIKNCGCGWVKKDVWDQGMRK